MSLKAVYSFDDAYRFVIQNYNWASPFSNFFPGIAGKWGIPMWIYYVNRAQAVCSVGIHNKDHAIMEFLSFNKACQVVGSQGFRTFMKMEDGRLYEPFCKLDDPLVMQKMLVSSHELEISETNPHFGIETSIVYFPLVNQPVAGLVRRLEITNRSGRSRTFELVDGLPRILPYGVTFDHVKVIPRHMEGMMGVTHIDAIPLFRLKQTPADVDQVGAMQGGNFYFSFHQPGELLRDNWVVDPALIFGDPVNFDYPWNFTEHRLDALIRTKQIRENRTPCAISAVEVTLEPGETYDLYSIVGFTPQESRFASFAQEMISDGVLPGIREENQRIIEGIKNHAFTVSGEPLFDQYCQQTFLENVMRGGMPLSLKGKEKDTHFYIYQRQNGDLERDYHWFVLEPTYLSQGNSHYRNILQNRRMDTWFFPQVKEHNLVMLASLVQLDGYNPLEVNSVTYTARNLHAISAMLHNLVADESEYELLQMLVRQPFTPGSFIMAYEGCKSRLRSDYEDILANLLPACYANEIGGLHEGYWIDHWLYLLDMIETIFMIYPDRVRSLLLDRGDYTYYDNPDTVMPWGKKTVPTTRGCRQYGAVHRDAEKQALIASRTQDATRVHTQHGHGEVFRSNLLVKMLSILANKIAVLDYRGLGVEMEASKPGWCDSLNGLPGLFGSSTCEALEIMRACRLLLDNLEIAWLADHETQLVYRELSDFLQQINQGMEKLLRQEMDADRMAFWHLSHQALEKYREETKLGISGQQHPVEIGWIRDFLHNCLRMLESNYENTPGSELFDGRGIPYTYFINEVGLNTSQSAEKKQANSFTSSPLPIFLEGPMHYLRVFPQQAAHIHSAVRQSQLFDPQLKMYRSCAPLDDAPLEIGRIKAYADGWLENQSIYTHMEYKWMLELLRAGQFEEFFTESRNILVPFMDPATYGRSTLENCSFIVSSAFPDESLHGKAFQPRLSGMTCEFLDMWTLMVAGKHPFTLDEDGKLIFQLEPALPGWLFTREVKEVPYWDVNSGWETVTVPRHSFAFRLFGTTLVIYHNSQRRDTFAPQVSAHRYHLRYKDGRKIELTGAHVTAPLASDVREGRFSRIDVDID
jgi:hypothetical protein